MNILVTGGAGFIGQHLTHYLLEKKHNVKIFDSLSNSSREGISSLIQSGAKFFAGDITDLDSLKNSLPNTDAVVHLAAKISVNESIKNPEETINVNVNGTKNLLEACIANNVKNIVAASSAAVYGAATDLPLIEDTTKLPISPYGKSKAEMEKLFQQFSNKYDLNCISLRFFNVYGIGQTEAYAGVLAKFLKNILDNQPIQIYGDGSNIRDFISVCDVVEAIHSGLLSIEGKKGNCYNIATGHSTSIKELAEMMLSISGKKNKIIFKQSVAGDISKSSAGIDLASKELNFSSSIQLEDGIKNLFDHYL